MTKIHYSTALPSYYFGQEPCKPPRKSTTAHRNAIAAILSPQDVVLDLDALTKERAFEEIARFIARRHELREADVHASLVEREKIGSTALGFGIAIPHARVTGLARPVAAFVRTKSPISFGAPDDKSVRDMLVLLVPTLATDEHLQLLAEVAEMLSDRKLRDSLRAQVEASAVHALLAGHRCPADPTVAA
jgi:PTS system nitrogen regulatory IIA component